VKEGLPVLVLSAAVTLSLLAGTVPCRGAEGYHTFADYPGFAEYFEGTCRSESEELPPDIEKALLSRYRPRFILPPGGERPLDFYRSYLPCTSMRRWPDRSLVSGEVSKGLLREHLRSRSVYLDFDPDCYGKRAPAEPVVYGRVYREMVPFPLEAGGMVEKELLFLKYNLLFSRSGLAADLPLTHRLLAAFPGLDAGDWHELDNFAAVHVVLDEGEEPLAVLLAQHNHHRTYLLGKDIFLPPDGRLLFDVAERSGEVYPSSASPEPQRHRVVRWSLYLDYLLSGENRPFFHAHDVTYGPRAGGSEVAYELAFLSSCDPLYRAEMLLGEPRPFMGRYIGRDGPPGSDYYNIPPLLPLGKLLKFAYLQDGDEDDIAAVRKYIDVKRDSINIDRIVDHGGRTFYLDWQKLAEGEGQ